MGKGNKKRKRQRRENDVAQKQNMPTDASPPNPLYEKQQEFLRSIPQDERNNFFSNTLAPDRRGELWMQQAEVGETLINKYSWATPDTQCLRILRHFSPIVEIGCGANAYWSRFMANAGIDVVAYDVDPYSGGTIPSGGQKKHNKNQQSEPSSSTSNSFSVKCGGPEILQEESGRTLFLCYPDEDGEVQAGSDEEKTTTSMGAACLEYYTGDYVIHVGELFGDTLAVDQAPWGRSSGPDFHVRLASEFHCILKATLSNWLHVRDTISVWKRTQKCSIVFATDSDEEDEQDEEVEYSYVPVEERIPTDIAAPCLAHLLGGEKSESTNTAHATTDTTESKPRSKKPV